MFEDDLNSGEKGGFVAFATLFLLFPFLLSVNLVYVYLPLGHSNCCGSI